MNSISSSELPPEWRTFVYIVMAGIFFYVAWSSAKKGFVEWELRLGGRTSGMKVGEKKFSRADHPIVYWSTQALVSFGFSFCLCAALIYGMELWLKIGAGTALSVLFLVYLSRINARNDIRDTKDE